MQTDYLYTALKGGKSDVELISEFCKQLNEAKKSVQEEKSEEIQGLREDLIYCLINYFNALIPDANLSDDDFEMFESVFSEFEKEIPSFLNPFDLKDLDEIIIKKKTPFSNCSCESKQKESTKEDNDDDIISAFLKLLK